MLDESKLNEITKKIEKIEKRNKKVEADKAWETSYTRRFFIAILTYLIVVLFFRILNLPKPFINAIVPTMGFLLSTLSISILKTIWLRYYNK
jgi:hypothetical protein